MKLKRFAIFFLVVVILVIIFGFNHYLRVNNLVFYATGSKDKAFLDVTWRMSPKEIERVNKTPLTSTFYLFHLDQPSKYKYSNVVNGKRYRYLKQDGHITLWGFNTEVKYAFFDNKLFEYTIFLRGYDSEKMHKNISSALTKRFGSGVVEDSGRYLHVMQWETESSRARYWLIEYETTTRVDTENKTINPPYLAGVKIRCKPLLEEIKQISLTEHKKIF